MKKVKMIITDLDNTLLRSGKYISEYTISVLKRCKEKGIKIIFATARSKQASSRYISQFTPDIFIGYGGALVLSGSDCIYRCDIPADVSFKLIRDCLRTPEISSILAVNESEAFTNNRLELMGDDMSHYRYCDFSEDNNLSCLKISVVSKSQEIVENIALNYPMCDLLRYTGENLYRFANCNAVKWNAVKAVAEYYNVSAENLAAFGDDNNDFEMLKNCGIGIAVNNGINEVKEIADYICESNDNDGVAKWIETNILY